MFRAIFLLAVFLALTACATSYEMVRIPLREADLYPLAQTKGKVTVAVDEMSNPPRVRRYFGTDLTQLGILPVNVIVSNHGPHRITVSPADVLLYRGRGVFDPLPLEVVKRAFRSADADTREQIDEYLAEAALAEHVLGPNETYQGLLFFEVLDTKATRSTFFSVLTLFPQGELRLKVTLTNLEADERLPFGPFPVAGSIPRRY